MRNSACQRLLNRITDALHNLFFSNSDDNAMEYFANVMDRYPGLPPRYVAYRYGLLPWPVAVNIPEQNFAEVLSRIEPQAHLDGYHHSAPAA